MNIGEADRLITLLTKEYGVIKAFASGVKNIKNKKSAGTSLLAYSDMLLESKGDTYKLKEVSPIRIFFDAGDDIKKLALSQYFCELCLNLAPVEQNAQDYLKLVLNSLHFLSKNKKKLSLIKAITEFRMLSLSGYAPELLACDCCGAFEDDLMFFDIQNATLYCSDCKPDGNLFRIDRTILSSLRHIIYSEFSKLYSFDIPDQSAKYLSTLTEKYLIVQTERKFYTLDFYNSIPEE